MQVDPTPSRHSPTAAGAQEINRAYLTHIRAWSKVHRFTFWQSLKQRLLNGDELRLFLLPGVLLTIPILKLYLRWHLAKYGRSSQHAPSPLHTAAIEALDTLPEQYPLHLYPIVAKAFELAALRRILPALQATCPKIIEIAIGEGTLSARIFPTTQQITGLDLNPYSLVKATQLQHVSRAIVGDALQPPVSNGSFDLLVSNNFLHHVSHKRSTIQHWSRIAATLVFNENTPYWKTAWCVPYILRHLGCRQLSARYATRIERFSAQCLEPIEKLTAHIDQHCTIMYRESFMSERTFFYCSIFSFLLRCYGPPTPTLIKHLFLGPLRSIALPATKDLARLLIRFDAAQDRTTDTFVLFVCRSKEYQPSTTGGDLLCPRCRHLLDLRNFCQHCEIQYQSRDNMLFLLPAELDHVRTEYRSDVAVAISNAHL